MKATIVLVAVLLLASCHLSHTETLDEYTKRFAAEHGLKIQRTGDVQVIQCDSPEDVAKRMNLPLEWSTTEIAVARVELKTGRIFLGRSGKDGQDDFLYEVAKYRLWPADWLDDQPKWRAIAQEFMEGRR